MAKLALTAFGPFPDVPENPTAQLLEHLRRQAALLPADTSLHLLEVDYQIAPKQLDKILAERPDLIVLMGYSNLATGITLEQCATSLCAADKPDNAGFAPISRNAPICETSFDLAGLETQLNARDIPTEISRNAGQYLCNFSYRHALQAMRNSALFVHLPAIAETPLAQTSAAALPLDTLAQAMQLICAKLIVDL